MMAWYGPRALACWAACRIPASVERSPMTTASALGSAPGGCAARPSAASTRPPPARFLDSRRRAQPRTAPVRRRPDPASGPGPRRGPPRRRHRWRSPGRRSPRPRPGPGPLAGSGRRRTGAVRGCARRRLSRNRAGGGRVAAADGLAAQPPGALSGATKPVTFFIRPSVAWLTYVIAGHRWDHMARVFITGSSDGLGLMAARRLVDEGHDVVLHARNDVRARDAWSRLPSAEAVVIGDLSTLAGMRHVAQQANARGPFQVF